MNLDCPEDPQYYDARKRGGAGLRNEANSQAALKASKSRES